MAEEVQKVMQKAVPAKDREFLESFEEIIVVGDYVIAHAGINPKRAVDDQKRRTYCGSATALPCRAARHVVVHGHTIFRSRRQW